MYQNKNNPSLLHLDNTNNRNPPQKYQDTEFSNFDSFAFQNSARNNNIHVI